MSCFTEDLSGDFPGYPIGMSTTLKRCFGSDQDPDSIVDFWRSGICPTTIHDYLYSNLTFDIDKFHDLQEGANKLVSDYYKDIQPSLPNGIEYHPIQGIIADLCSSRSVQGVEGICDQVLSKLCNGCSRDQIANNTPYLRLCGCYAPPLPGSGIGTGTVKYPIQCDSLCNKPQNVATLRDNSPPYAPISCLASKICVITDVNFISNGVEVDGTFNLQERCDGCTADAPCECIIDSTLPDQIRRLGFNDAVTFKSFCGANSICVVRDPATGNTTNVDCETQLFASTVVSSSTSSFLKVNKYFWGIMIALVFIACLIAVAIKTL